jgi:hypothetical protein
MKPQYKLREYRETEYEEHEEEWWKKKGIFNNAIITQFLIQKLQN